MRVATRDDLPRIVEIYNSTVASRLVTADTEEVTVQARVPWFERHTPGKRPLMVHEVDGVIAGWISFETFYGRPAYQHTAEISIYIAPEHRRQGLGRRLLQGAMDLAPTLGIKTLMGFIFSHNEPSLKLFRSHGFEEWGRFPDIAEMDGEEYSLSILGKRLVK